MALLAYCSQMVAVSAVGAIICAPPSPHGQPISTRVRFACEDAAKAAVRMELCCRVDENDEGSDFDLKYT
jgi:hypothetical protein